MTRPANPDLKIKIKSLAVRDIVKKGCDSISMRDIAQKAGITPTTIYYYYKNKVDLFEEIKRDAMDSMDEYIISRISKSNSYEKKLDTIMEAFMDWSLGNPELARMVFDKLPNRIDNTLYSKSYYKTIEIIEEGKKCGEFKVKDSELDVTVGTASMYGLALILISNAYHPKYKNRINEMKRRLIKMFITQIKNN